MTKLSDRLETIIGMVKPCRVAADIGCDHGFTAIRLVESGIADCAVASDVRSGPLKRAKEHVREAGLTGKIDLREGDGLMTLMPDEAEAVIIAGMGGRLMTRLLEEGADRLGAAKQLILSPHADVPAVRRCVSALGFRIEEERIVEELGNFYTVMRAVPGEETLTPLQENYGPRLLETRPAEFLEMLRRKKELCLERLEQIGVPKSERAALARQENEALLSELEALLQEE